MEKGEKALMTVSVIIFINSVGHVIIDYKNGSHGLNAYLQKKKEMVMFCSPTFCTLFNKV